MRSIAPKRSRNNRSSSERCRPSTRPRCGARRRAPRCRRGAIEGSGRRSRARRHRALALVAPSRGAMRRLAPEAVPDARRALERRGRPVALRQVADARADEDLALARRARARAARGARRTAGPGWSLRRRTARFRPSSCASGRGTRRHGARRSTRRSRRARSRDPPWQTARPRARRGGSAVSARAAAAKQGLERGHVPGARSDDAPSVDADPPRNRGLGRKRRRHGTPPISTVTARKAQAGVGAHRVHGLRPDTGGRERAARALSGMNAMRLTSRAYRPTRCWGRSSSCRRCRDPFPRCRQGRCWCLRSSSTCRTCSGRPSCR